MLKLQRQVARAVAREGERSSRGIAVVAVLVLVMLLATAALVIDYGYILLGRTELSRAVDAAALAAAQDLPNRGAAAATAQTYVRANVPSRSYSEPVPAVTFPAGNVVRVRAAMTSPSFFAALLGFDDFPIAAVAEARRLDPDVALVVDRSGSMCQDSHPRAGANCPATGPWEPFSTVQSTAKLFVDQMPGDPTFTLISYSTAAEVNVITTSNRALVKAGIDNLRPSGYTDIAGSLEMALNQLLLLTGARPKVVVLLTDGRPNVVNGRYVGDGDSRPRQALIDGATKAKDKGVIVHGINYGVDTDNDLMKQVAEKTEGRFHFAPDDESLVEVYTEIAGNPHIRLTYTD
jgi:Mg-chelatase subunit ChlD